MLATLLFFIGAYGLGTTLSRVIPGDRFWAERVALRFVIGFFLATWLLLLSCWLLGYTGGAVATLGSLILVTIWVCRRAQPERQKFVTLPQGWLWLAVTGTLSLLVSYLLYTHMLGPGPDGVYSAGGSWGDLPLHLSIISATARQTHFTWNFSLMVGAKLTYPFLIDFLSGVFHRWGLSLPSSLLFTSIPLSLGLIQLLFFASYRLLKNLRAAAFATVLFFFSGSSFGFVLAGIEWWQLGHHLSFLGNLPHDYSNTSLFGFGNFINTILMPQRSFQFGLPVFLAILLLILALHEAKPQRPPFSAFLLLGLLFGLLPLSHTHTFFVTAALLGFWIALIAWQEHRPPWPWLGAFFLGIGVALPQLLFQFRGNYHSGFVQVHLGWMFSGGSIPYHIPNWLALSAYILANFGLVLIWLLVSFRRRLPLMVQVVAGIGLALFLAGNLFVFQPASYDNIKFFIYSYLFFGWVIAERAAVLSRNRRSHWLAGIMIGSLIATGVLGVAWETRQHVLLYPTSTLAAADRLRPALPNDALVLTSDYHQHPLWALVGQPVVRGYSYWLWSYGLPVEQLDHDVPTMYAGGSAAAHLLQKYHIAYVYIGPSEHTLYSVNEGYYASHFSVVYTDPAESVTIYQIKF